MYSVPDDPIRAGFPHSDIRGSKFARNSPRLFAACHVLHRLSVPRHPPGALETLDPGLAHSGKPRQPYWASDASAMTLKPRNLLSSRAVIPSDSFLRSRRPARQPQRASRLTPISRALPDESTSSFPIHDVLEHRRSSPGSAIPGAMRRVFCVPISEPSAAWRPTQAGERPLPSQAGARWWRRPDSNR